MYSSVLGAKIQWGGSLKSTVSDRGVQREVVPRKTWVVFQLSSVLTTTLGVTGIICG